MEVVSLVRNLPHIADSALRRQLLGDGAQWGPDEENRARLLEVMAYTLQLDWFDRTADADPSAKREREEARRQGLKPPRNPIIPPAALRPGEMAEQRIQEYLEELARNQPEPLKRIVNLDEFDLVISQL